MTKEDFTKIVSCKHKTTGQLYWIRRDRSVEFTLNPRKFHWRKIGWYIFVSCFYRRYPPILFSAKAYEDACRKRNGAKFMSSNALNWSWSATGSFALFGTWSLLGYWFPFWGDGVFLSTQFERFAATDLMVEDSARFLTATPGEPAEAGSEWIVLRLSVLEDELTDLFTEVSENISLSPACV